MESWLVKEYQCYDWNDVTLNHQGGIPVGGYDSMVLQNGYVDIYIHTLNLLQWKL